jgi:hypothetical protein
VRQRRIGRTCLNSRFRYLAAFARRVSSMKREQIIGDALGVRRRAEDLLAVVAT